MRKTKVMSSQEIYLENEKFERFEMLMNTKLYLSGIRYIDFSSRLGAVDSCFFTININY